ncbi:sigma-54 interaction domain-containing protein [Clostridium fungisolvens]|uniref:Anaerobic nitric oxide reductase transcription regulator NorR n=1 Tax=Clostridium fungisolvens TaxID=1604897 RepID=A0A6V8SIH1_9CLOT|nr:sigma 54-interacting transcriptional regulator [Clostridium fungisolvens]GFP76372.1 Anaerobic nitric oxide reductase transcription regulator NorR [Clostridium fungisolvens]
MKVKDVMNKDLESLGSKIPLNFDNIPVLFSEDELISCKGVIDDEYLNNNYYVYVLNQKKKLVGFITCDYIRLFLKEKVLFMFLSAIDHIHDGVVLVDKHSKIIYLNKAYSEILNIDKEKVLNKYVSEIEPGAAILSTLREGTPIQNKKIKVKSIEKQIVASINPIIIDNEVLGAISIFKDVTEIHVLNEELANVRKLSGYFYEGIAKPHNELPKNFSCIVGSNEKFLNCLKLAAIVAPTDATVLVQGESGVGKEVVVKAIYEASKRSEKPYVELNCSAIPESLFESELFGYTDGAFTGAHKSGKIGKFEAANTGTIFLDEIGDMPMLMQAKLLRVLQSGQIQKIGSNTINKVDVRVIAATNRDLKAMIKEGTFREDLYFRLNTFNINIPSLRERVEDIINLAEYFLNIYCKKYNKTLMLSENVINVLSSYKWVGNVRELQSCMEYAVIICQDDIIEVEHLPEEIKKSSIISLNRDDKTESKKLKHEILDIERERIIEALEKFNGNKTRAMDMLGMSRRTFYKKLKLYNIDAD